MLLDKLWRQTRLYKTYDSLSNDKGSVLLLVVIIMSIVFIMSSIVFGYSLRTYRLNQDINELKKAETLSESSLNETVVQILNRIDNEEVIESYTLTNNLPFPSDPKYSYESIVQEEGFFNPASYVVTGNVKTLKIKSSIEPEEEEDPADPEEPADPVDPADPPEPEEPEEPTTTIIAIEVKSYYIDAQVTKRAIMTITKTEDNYLDVKIYNCR